MSTTTTTHTEDDELSLHFPDEILRDKLKQGMFHDDVLQAFADLKKESQEYIVYWVQEKHGDTKAVRLFLIALNS